MILLCTDLTNNNKLSICFTEGTIGHPEKSLLFWTVLLFTKLSKHFPFLSNFLYFAAFEADRVLGATRPLLS